MLKPFNEALDADLYRVFFNLGEFGEVNELAGHEVPMVWEPFSREMTEVTDDRTSVNYDYVTVYVRGIDVQEKFEPGRQISFMGNLWFVQSVTDTELMRTFRLYREKA